MGKVIQSFKNLKANLKQGTKLDKYIPIAKKISGNYHTKAQTFINSAKSKGMTVKAEGGELIAYPPKPQVFKKTRANLRTYGNLPRK